MTLAIWMILVVVQPIFSQSEGERTDLLNKQRWEELRSREDLTYTKEVQGRNENKKEESGDSNQKKKDSQNQNSASTPLTINLGALGQLIFVVLFIALLGWLLFLIIGKELMGRKNKEIVPESLVNKEFEEEFDTETELQRLLREAQEAKNYKMIIRIYFIMIIKQMDESRLIRWKKEKTNLDYIYELEGNSFQPGFINLSRWYDLIWYGEKEYADEALQPLSIEFGTFQEQLKQVAK